MKPGTRSAAAAGCTTTGAGGCTPSAQPKRRWLELYAEHFDTVEVNSHLLPAGRAREAVAGWVAQTPPEFLFAVKASRYLTHIKRLVDIAGGDRALLRAARAADRGRAARTRAVAAARELPPRRRAPRRAGSSCCRRAGTRSSSATRLVRARGDGRAARARGGADDRRPSRAAVPDLRGHGGLALHPLPLRRAGSARELLAPPRSTSGRGGSLSGAGETEVYAYFNNDWEGFAPANAKALGRATRTISEFHRTRSTGTPEALLDLARIDVLAVAPRHRGEQQDPLGGEAVQGVLDGEHRVALARVAHGLDAGASELLERSRGAPPRRGRSPRRRRRSRT